MEKEEKKEVQNVYSQNKISEFEVDSDIENENEPGLITDFKLTSLKMLNNSDKNETKPENNHISITDQSKNLGKETSEDNKTVEHIKIRLAPKPPKRQLQEETTDIQNIEIKETSNFLSQRSNSQTNNDPNSCYKVFVQKFSKNLGKEEKNLTIMNLQLDDLPHKNNTELKLNHAISQQTFEILSSKKESNYSPKKSNYEKKIQDDLDQLSLIKAIPQINKKSREIIQISQKNQELNKFGNIFEKLSNIKPKETNQIDSFPFKPNIIQNTKRKAQAFITDSSKKMLDKVIQDDKKIYKNLKEQMKKEEYISRKKAGISMSMQIRNLNKEIDSGLKKMDISENFISKDNLKTLMQSLSYLHSNNYKGENELFEEFWDICSDRQSLAKIDNVKILLIAISKILKSEIIEKKMNLLYDTLFQLNLNEAKINPIPTSNVPDRKIINESEDPLSLKHLVYDNDKNIILSMKSVNELSKQFITLYCNRFSRKIKNEEKANKNRKPVKIELNLDQKNEDNNNFNSQSKSNLRIPDLIQRLFYSCSARSRSPNRDANLHQPQLKFSKHELITRIASSTERKSINNQEKSYVQKFNLGNSKLYERLNYCKKRSVNKSHEMIEFENQKEFLTFTPKISFIKKSKNSIMKLNSSQELEVQRMRRGHSERRRSAHFIDLISKQGQTSIRNDSEYKKFKNDFKELSDSDLTLNKKVHKYVKNYDLESITKGGKINLNPKQLNLRDFLSIQKGFSPDRISLNLHSCKYKNLPNYQTQLKKDEQSISTSVSLKSAKRKLPIAIIKINSNDGIKTIKVTKQENLSAIAAKIAAENSSINRSK